MEWKWDAVRGDPRGVVLDLGDCFLSALQSIRAHSTFVWPICLSVASSLSERWLSYSHTWFLWEMDAVASSRRTSSTALDQQRLLR